MSQKQVKNPKFSRDFHCILETIVNTIHSNKTEDIPCTKGHLCLVQRDTWKAHPPISELKPQKLPLHRVIISHTVGRSCDSLVSKSPIKSFCKFIYILFLYNFTVDLPQYSPLYARISYAFIGTE